MDEDDDNDDDERLIQAGLDDLSRNSILNNPNRFEYEKRKFHEFESNTTSLSSHRR